jgi:hypothetical protein
MRLTTADPVTGRPEQDPATTCEAILDAAHEAMTRGRVEEGLDDLVGGLRGLRLACDGVSWEAVVRVCRGHAVRGLVHQDPFTYRAYSKPRGYAGDAELLDFIYGVDEGRPAPPGTSALGRRIFAHNTTHGPAPRAVRARRRILARLVDEVSAGRPRPRILSVAAGHLREAELAAAVREGRTGEYVALDQDGESLETVRRCYSGFGVRTVSASVRRLLGGGLDLGTFDLIYSAGLYDYLRRSTAAGLTRVLFGMLRAGGRLLVANFVPGIRDIGYMESFMDWELVYRTPGEVRELGAAVDPGQLAGAEVFTEDGRNIAFLLLTRR